MPAHPKTLNILKLSLIYQRPIFRYTKWPYKYYKFLSLKNNPALIIHQTLSVITTFCFLSLSFIFRFYPQAYISVTPQSKMINCRGRHHFKRAEKFTRRLLNPANFRIKNLIQLAFFNKSFLFSAPFRCCRTVCFHPYSNEKPGRDAKRIYILPKKSVFLFNYYLYNITVDTI